MAGNFEYPTRDVRVTERSLHVRFPRAANPAQGAIQVQYSPPGHLQYLKFTPLGPQRPLCYKCSFFARQDPKLI